MTMNHWYQSMYQMFEIFSDFIEAWLCYGFVGLFLPDRVRGKVPSFILSLLLVGSVRAMDTLGMDPMISTLWFVFYICMTTVVLFQVNLFYAVSLVSFYILCLYVINYFCMSVMGVIAGNRQFAQFILNQLSLLRCIYLAANTALLLLLYMLIRHAFKGGLLYSPRMLFAISLLGILGITFLSVVTLQDISVITLFSWSLCLIMVLCFIFLLLFYSNYMKEHELRSILELKDQMVRQEYEMVKQLQQEQQSLSHDLKNHLLVMDTMLKEGKYQEARNYMGQLGIPLERLSPSIWTGTSTLDVLLNHTRNRCSQSHITFTVQADAVDLRPMKDQDICSLFANLLDNAYEAAHSMPEGQGWILFKMRKAREMLFIDLSNSSPAPPCVKNGALISRKQDGRLHGLGLNRASITAREYGGQLTYGYEGGVFTASISFLGGVKGRELEERD